jgi:hypothetical protein
MADKYRDIFQLKIASEEAQRVARERNWLPPRLDELQRIFAETGARYVESGEDLLTVIQESLNSLQRIFVEERMMRFLWNERDGQWRPKTELELSDYIRSHLATEIGQRRVIVNREVQLKARAGSAKGLRTDIHVNAFRVEHGGQIDPILVIVEVKGSWNRQVVSALQDQLVGDYMTETACHNGLYLVVWVRCPSWDTSDSREREGWRDGLHELRELLAAKSAESSSDGRVVRSVILDASLPAA